MNIKQVTSQHRRDFTTSIACKYCGKEVVNSSGYDTTTTRECSLVGYVQNKVTIHFAR